MADLVISENKGQKFPPCLKLSDVCQKYSDNAQPLDQKDKLKVSILEFKNEMQNNKERRKKMCVQRYKRK